MFRFAFIHLGFIFFCRFSAFFVKGREFLVLGFLTASVIFMNSVIGIVFFTGIFDSNYLSLIAVMYCYTIHQISLQVEKVAPLIVKPYSNVLCPLWSAAGRVGVSAICSRALVTMQDTLKKLAILKRIACCCVHFGSSRTSFWFQHVLFQR